MSFVWQVKQLTCSVASATESETDVAVLITVPAVALETGQMLA